jgi:hypothetical protein
VARRLFIILGKVLLVAITLLFLSSMGGAMAFGAPILVPVHAMAAKDAANGYSRAGWILLAVLSISEASWIYAYVFLNDDGAATIGSLVVAITAGVIFTIASARNEPTT